MLFVNAVARHNIKPKSMYRKLESDDYVSFFVLHGAGITLKTIGELFGCSAKTVSKYLKANYEWAKNEAARRYGKRRGAVCGSV